MKDQFVTYEIAKKLKELGFEERTFAYFDTDNKNEFKYHSTPRYGLGYHTPAPLWQQAEKFVLDRKLSLLGIRPVHELYPDPKFLGFKTGFTAEELFDTYESAREAAILKALELITK